MARYPKVLLNTLCSIKLTSQGGSPAANFCYTVVVRWLVGDFVPGMEAGKGIRGMQMVWSIVMGTGVG